MATGDLPLREETLCLRATLLIHSSEIDSELVHSDRLRQIQMDPSKYHHKSLGYFLVIMFYQTQGFSSSEVFLFKSVLKCLLWQCGYCVYCEDERQS